MEESKEIQNECCRIIYKMCSGQGNMYAIIKEIIRIRGGPDAGGVRTSLANLEPGDASVGKEAADMVAAAIGKLEKCG